jgi:hypothetical protein
MNRENMEKWIKALETHQGKQARRALREIDGAMCAMGIGIFVACPEMNSNLYIAGGFAKWLGINQRRPNGLCDIPLKLDDSGTTSVVEANDEALQDFWTIAQRLRDTYLKDES